MVIGWLRCRTGVRHLGETLMAVLQHVVAPDGSPLRAATLSWSPAEADWWW